MLRLLSFNMDYHWACTRQKAQNVREDVRYSLVRIHIVTVLNKVPFFPPPLSSVVREQSIPLNIKQRCATAHNLDFYNPLNYFAYVVYPPLYIAGPIMTFNDFYWQVNLCRWFHRVRLELIFDCSVVTEARSH